MSIVVSIKHDTPGANARLVVVTQAIVEDGRELHPNGEERIEPGGEATFVVHSTRSLRLYEEPIAPEGEAV